MERDTGRRIAPKLLAEMGEPLTLNDLSERLCEDRDAIRWAVRRLVRRGKAIAIRPPVTSKVNPVKYQRAVR